MKLLASTMLGVVSIAGASLMATTPVHADNVADIKLNTSTMVTDNANILTQKTKDVVLQADTAAKQAPLNGHIAMVTVNSTDGESIDDYSKSLLSQPDWKNMSGKYGVSAVIIFAKNNGQNNVRISTTNNAEAFVNNQRAMDYLKSNAATLKSTDTAKINDGLQNVTKSIQKDFVNGNPDALSNSDSDDEAILNSMRSVINADIAKMAKVVFSALLILIAGGVVVAGMVSLKKRKYRKLSNETVASDWYKAVTSASDLSTFDSVESLSGAFYEIIDANGDTHIVDHRIDKHPAVRVRDYLEDTFPQLFANQKVRISKKGDVVISSKKAYQNWLSVARKLETVAWHQVPNNADFYEGTFQNKRMIITASMHDAIPMKSIAELSKYVVIGTNDVNDLHELFGTQDQYSAVIANDIPKSVYDMLFPTEKMYKKYKTRKLSKSQFSESHDGYQYTSSNSDSDIFSSALYGLIFSEMAYSYDNDYDRGDYGYDSGSSYSSGSSFDSGSSFSSFDGGSSFDSGSSFDGGGFDDGGSSF